MSACLQDAENAIGHGYEVEGDVDIVKSKVVVVGQQRFHHPNQIHHLRADLQEREGVWLRFKHSRNTTVTAAASGNNLDESKAPAIVSTSKE